MINAKRDVTGDLLSGYQEHLSSSRPASVCRNLLHSASVCPNLPQSATVCLILLLPASFYLNLLQPASICYSPSYSGTVWLIPSHSASFCLILLQSVSICLILPCFASALPQYALVCLNLTQFVELFLKHSDSRPVSWQNNYPNHQ